MEIIRDIGITAGVLLVLANLGIALKNMFAPPPRGLIGLTIEESRAIGAFLAKEIAQALHEQYNIQLDNKDVDGPGA